MRRFRTLAVFGVLLGLTLYFGGMLSYKLLSGSALSGNHQTSLARPGVNAHTDSIGIEGSGLIQVYRPDGSLRTTWKGHNALTPFARDAIAFCASGVSTNPGGFTSCSGWTLNMTVNFSTTTGITPVLVGATNALTCPSVHCTGWVATGGEAVAPFSGTVPSVSAGVGVVGFDLVSVNPPIAVNQGDRVVATITFTVS